MVCAELVCEFIERTHAGDSVDTHTVDAHLLAMHDDSHRAARRVRLDPGAGGVPAGLLPLLDAVVDVDCTRCEQCVPRCGRLRFVGSVDRDNGATPAYRFRVVGDVGLFDVEQYGQAMQQATREALINALRDGRLADAWR